MAEAKQTMRPNPQAASLGRLLFRLNRAMAGEFRARLKRLGVSGPEWTALSQISRGPITPVALADYMEVDRAAVTRILRQLEDKKLIRRTPHPTDGRSSILILTTKGTRLMPRLIDAARSTNHSFLSLLPPPEAQQLVRLLEQLAQQVPKQTFTMDECTSEDLR